MPKFYRIFPFLNKLKYYLHIYFVFSSLFVILSKKEYLYWSYFTKGDIYKICQCFKSDILFNKFR